jgi:hypothetical protein
MRGGQVEQNDVKSVQAWMWGRQEWGGPGHGGQRLETEPIGFVVEGTTKA